MEEGDIKKRRLSPAGAKPSAGRDPSGGRPRRRQAQQQSQQQLRSQGSPDVKPTPADAQMTIDKVSEGTAARKENDVKASPPKTTAGSAAAAGKKKRHRRKRKAGEHHQGRVGVAGGPSGSNKWKPYDELTWEERKALEERETQRAAIRREERMASGQPMAPYNTTQFLMDQHDQAPDVIAATAAQLDAPVARRPSRLRRSSGSLTLEEEEDEETSRTSEDCDNVGVDDNDETVFLKKDFADAYENFRAERLQTLSKEDLVREYLEMEGRLDQMGARLGGLVGRPAAGQGGLVGGPGGSVDVVAAVREEMERLREENRRLVVENEQLKGGVK